MWGTWSAKIDWVGVPGPIFMLNISQAEFFSFFLDRNTCGRMYGEFQDFLPTYLWVSLLPCGVGGQVSWGLGWEGVIRESEWLVRHLGPCFPGPPSNAHRSGVVSAASAPLHRVLRSQEYLSSWGLGLGPWHLLYIALWEAHWVGSRVGVNKLLIITPFSFPTLSSLATDRVCVSLTRAKSCVFSRPNILSLTLGHNLVILTP